MARNKKLQRAEKSTAAKVTQAVKETVVEAAKAVVKAAEKTVVEPVQAALGIKKEKPPKKKHVRPPKRTPVVKAPPLARGTTKSAKTMSAVVAKTVLKADDKKQD